MKHKKSHHKANRKARRKTNTKAHSKAHRIARRKSNGLSRSYSRRKRNAMESGYGMKALKAFGAVMAGAAIAIGGMLLLSATSLSAMAQDGILIAGGVVIGGALFAMGHTHVGVAVMVGPTTLGLSRRVLTWGITARASELIASIQNTLTPGATATATAPAAPPAAPPATAPANGFYGYQPGGYLTASPSWQPGMAQQSVQLDSLVNYTTPMVQYGMG